MLYAAADKPLGGDVVVGGGGGADVVVGGGEVVVGGGDVVVGGGVRVCVGVGELLCWGVGVGEGADVVGLFCTGDVAGVLFAGPWAARLLAALLLVADGAGPLVAEPALDLSVRCGFAPVRPTDWPGAGALAVLGVVAGEAAE
jgi:hypothetical protein